MTFPTKGFLELASSGNVPHRLTRTQADEVIQAIRSVVRRTMDHPDSHLHLAPYTGMSLQEAEAIVITELNNYPHDKSCKTCDQHEVRYSSAESASVAAIRGTIDWCRHWAQEIPADAIEAGCEHRHEDEVPF